MNNEFEYYAVIPMSGMPSLIFPDSGANKWEVDGNLEVMDEETNELYCFQLGIDVHSPLTKIDLITMEFGDPYPKKPNMTDYLERSSDGVISEKLYRILEPLQIKAIRLIPAIIQHKKTRYNYYYIHNYNSIECIDRENSEYQYDEQLNEYDWFDKISLDTGILSKIPLEERLIFRLGEWFTFWLFHKSVVDAILSVNPTGIRFVNVKDWTTGSGFD